MRNILVEPEILETTASKIEGMADQYSAHIDKLYSAVDVMSTAWEGKDNVAFTTQIYGFEDDLKQVLILCRQYVDFLRNTARAYRETQDEIATQAHQLAN